MQSLQCFLGLRRDPTRFLDHTNQPKISNKRFHFDPMLDSLDLIIAFLLRQQLRVYVTSLPKNISRGHNIDTIRHPVHQRMILLILFGCICRDCKFSCWYKERSELLSLF